MHERYPVETFLSPSPESPILVIGAAGVDIVGILRGELDHGTSNPAQIRSSFGGVTRNVAENLARLGQPVILLTAVGYDQEGDQLIQQTCNAGVDVSRIVRSKDYPTGTYLAVVNSRGELQYALDDMRAISTLTPSYLQSQATLFQEASLLFVDANLSKETLRKAVSLAHRANLPICADPTSTMLADKLHPYLSRISMITPNSAEAGILCGRVIDPSKRRQSLEAAKCLVSQGVDIAIITRARFGVCYATSEISGQVPAIRSSLPCSTRFHWMTPFAWECRLRR
jgi:pseudouridine kinase